MKVVSRVVCLVALAVLLLGAAAYAADWTALGEKSVDFKAKSVAVDVAAGAGSFAKLKIDVTGNVLKVATVKVTFTDGQTFDAAVNAFAGSGNSPEIDLASAKEIKKVEIGYQKAQSTDKFHPALVKLLGSV